MKTKVLLTMILIPMIAIAHPGHEHHIIDILLTPSTWSDHTVILVVGFVLFALIIGLAKKYIQRSKKIISE